MKTPMNGKRAGVSLPLLSLVALCLLWCGCKHSKPDYAELMSRLNAGVRGTNRVAQLQTVALSNKLDQAWLKPSPALFTLGPGDRIEIEVIGEPLSRTTTIV